MVKKGVTTNRNSMHNLFTSCMEISNAYRSLQSTKKINFKRKLLQMPLLYPATPQTKQLIKVLKWVVP